MDSNNLPTPTDIVGVGNDNVLLCLLQDPKMLADLDSRGNGNLDSRTVTICSGLDFVNITYNNFVATDEKTAKV